MKLTKNFSLWEFACNDGTAVPAEYIANVQKLATQLQVLRDFFGAPIAIRSGYRTPAYNKIIGGAAHSQHLTASAADIEVAGWFPKEVQRAIEGLIRVGLVADGGLGEYAGFTHYDVRGHRARWEGPHEHE